jgi:hypothetical protein
VVTPWANAGAAGSAKAQAAMKANILLTMSFIRVLLD